MKIIPKLPKKIEWEIPFAQVVKPLKIYPNAFSW